MTSAVTTVALTVAACSSTAPRATPGPRATVAPSVASATSSGSPAIAPSGAGGVSPSVTAALPRLFTCANTAVFRPTRYVFACGDGNAYVQHARWTSWTPAAAQASATWVQNDCTPYCAAGHFHSYPVRLRFDRPERTSAGLLFTRWTATFPGRSPLGRHVVTQADYLPTTVTVYG